MDQLRLNHWSERSHISVMYAGMDSFVAAGQMWVHQQTWVHRWRHQHNHEFTFRSGFTSRFWCSRKIHNQNCIPCWFTARGLHCLKGSDCKYCHGDHTLADLVGMRGGGQRQRARRSRAVLMGLMRRMFRRWLKHHYQCWHTFYNVLT
jgi:hypothetical protein